MGGDLKTARRLSFSDEMRVRCVLYMRRAIYKSTSYLTLPFALFSYHIFAKMLTDFVIFSLIHSAIAIKCLLKIPLNLERRAALSWGEIVMP